MITDGRAGLHHRVTVILNSWDFSQARIRVRRDPGGAVAALDRFRWPRFPPDMVTARRRTAISMNRGGTIFLRDVWTQLRQTSVYPVRCRGIIPPLPKREKLTSLPI